MIKEKLVLILLVTPGFPKVGLILVSWEQFQKKNFGKPYVRLILLWDDKKVGDSKHGVGLLSIKPDV